MPMNVSAKGAATIFLTLDGKSVTITVGDGKTDPLTA
jgi:hypothetical protein